MRCVFESRYERGYFVLVCFRFFFLGWLMEYRWRGLESYRKRLLFCFDDFFIVCEVEG